MESAPFECHKVNVMRRVILRGRSGFVSSNTLSAGEGELFKEKAKLHVQNYIVKENISNKKRNISQIIKS